MRCHIWIKAAAIPGATVAAFCTIAAKRELNVSDERTGGCLCGAVRFRTRGDVGPVSYCHCTQCRRQTGHYLASTNVSDDRIAIEGAQMLTWYAASAEARRGFCSACGSVLFWKPNEGGYHSVLAGSFDKPSGLVAESHIFVADKGDYYEITDGLPKYPASST
jgi:hypothetical protein